MGNNTKNPPRSVGMEVEFLQQHVIDVGGALDVEFAFLNLEQFHRLGTVNYVQRLFERVAVILHKVLGHLADDVVGEEGRNGVV